MWGILMFFENGPCYTQSDCTIISKWTQSDPKSLLYAKNDPKVTPKWHGPLGCGCRLSLALARLLWPSKYAVEMSISCLWAHLGPIKVVMLTTLAQKIIILKILMPKSRHLHDFSMNKTGYGHLFIDGRIYSLMDRHLFIDGRIYL